MANRNNINKIYEINVIDWDKKKLQKYFTLLIIGYFGVKIIYGFFNKYTQKPMRDELSDFSIMIVMGLILYLLTNIETRNLLGHLNNINWFFFIGYIIGLNFPFFYEEFFSNEDILRNKPLQYIFYGVFLFILLIMIYLSIRTSTDNGNPLYYMLYLIVIGIIIMGIIITRKKPKIFSSTKLNENGQNAINELSQYFDSDNLNNLISQKGFKEASKKSFKTGNIIFVIDYSKHYLDFSSIPKTDLDHIGNLLASLYKPILEKGYISLHGTYISFGLASIGWLLSLLFMYDAEEMILNRFISLFNGFTIGLFVSGVSFYGFEYILSDQKEKKCFDENKCNKNDLIFNNKEYTNIVSTLSTLKWVLFITLLILIIVIILFYTLRF
jgi:hypothetical protein